MHYVSRLAAIPAMFFSLVLILAGCGANELPTESDPGSADHEDTVFRVEVERTYASYQGYHEYIDVSLTQGSLRLSGFDLVLGYDSLTLDLTDVTPGDIFDECGWEYFTHRRVWSYYCHQGCPGKLVRVVGIADIDNGAVHPDFNCRSDLLFTMDLLVTDDRTYECMFVPIRFFWMDCDDNSLAYSDEEANGTMMQAVARDIYDIGNARMTDPTTGFPTLTGVQDRCLLTDPDAVQFVDFINGGIDIICPDSIDPPGSVAKGQRESLLK